jgi:type VI secretion system protein VasD
LYDDDQKVLGAEMLSRQEFMLAPSASQTVELNLADDAQFVGAVAAFHDIRNAQWRVIVPAPRAGFTLSVERARLIVAANESN